MKAIKIRLLIADDHTIVRRALVSLLSQEPDIEVVAEAADGRAAVDLAAVHEPDVVLMDISMPLLNGLEATRLIRERSDHTRVLVLSAHDNDEYVTQVVRSGANGYILKNSPVDELRAAIRSVYSGRAFFSPAVSKVLLEEYIRATGVKDREEAFERPGRRLTSREREILQLVAEGVTHSRIAEQLHVSIRTVDTHCNHIMKKLDIHDRAGLVTYAIKNGIVILAR